MVKSVLILEQSGNKLTLENTSSTKSRCILGGEFTRFNVKNRNERIYTPEKFIPALDEMKTRINEMVVYGEMDHPDVFDTSLKNASHVIKSCDYVPESNAVFGKIQLLSYGRGKDARTIVDDGLPLFVSSRAAGITESDGSVSIKKLFTYDLVADPGFPTAKVEALNESLGFSKNANFRIFEMKNEEKINELFNMNKNDYVTKEMIDTFSKYQNGEIAKMKKQLEKMIKEGRNNPSEINDLLERYDEMNTTQSKILQYLDYLADKVQISLSETKSIKETQVKIIEHNDYLAGEIEKVIEYADYIVENVDNLINFSEYIAENLDKAIDFSEYIAENLNKNIAYSEYIAENLDSSIAFSEYIAENLESSIEFSEYIAEHLDTNIAYSEYIAENLDETILYSEYIAEKLNGSLNYSRMIAEKLNSRNKLNENYSEEDTIAYPEEFGMEYIEDGDEFEMEETEMGDESEADLINTPEMEINMEVEESAEESETDENTSEVEVVEESEVETETEESETETEEEFDAKTLESKIDLLIERANKQKVVESQESYHFLTFLTKSQKDAFNALTAEDKDRVVLHINEKKGQYFTGSQVLALMNEALTVEAETMESKLVRLMPESIKPIWESISDEAKISILSQHNFLPVKTDEQIEHFWLTRDFKVNETKKLVSKEDVLLESFTDAQIKSILDKIHRI